MILAQIVLVLLHGAGGHEVLVNPQQVTSLHASIPHKPSEYFTDGVRCMIRLTDGKFVTVIESCEAVKHQLEEAKQ